MSAGAIDLLTIVTLIGLALFFAVALAWASVATGQASLPDARLVAAFRRVATVVAFLAVALGVAVLLGWALDITVLKSVSPRWVTMKPLTAISFVLTGTALFLLRTDSPSPPALAVSRTAATAAVAIGVATLIEYAGGWDFGIENSLFPDAVAARTPYPGRLSLMTAINFILAGTALGLVAAPSRRARTAAQILIFVELITSLLAVAGYAYGIDSLYEVAPYSSMAMHSALGFIALGAGTLFIRPELGWMAAVVDAGPGGILLRWLVPGALVVPFLVGWLRLVGQRAGLYQTEFGLGIMVLASSLGFLVVASWVAGLLNTADAERLHVEREIRELNDQLEQRVAERTRQLEGANRELEAFSYSVSHDLRAPLRAIDGWASVLSEDYGEALGEAGRELLQRQRKASQQMARLIDDLLSLARLSRQELNRRDVDVAELVGRVWKELGVDGKVHAELVVGDLPHCRADPALLEQVFVNLLGNALKFSKRRNKPRVEVGYQWRADHQPIYFVRDNGAGFDMRFADKLFEPFQRLHSAHEFPGVGVGLPIVQRIVHRHGGRVWAEGAVDQGATFYFSLPGEPSKA